MSISSNFVAFLAIMALRPSLVVFVNNISEGSRDVAFKDKSFSQYGNLNSNKELKFPYLHYILITCTSFTIVIVIMRNSWIEQ
jgi:hypothetical protein